MVNIVRAAVVGENATFGLADIAIDEAGHRILAPVVAFVAIATGAGFFVRALEAFDELCRSLALLDNGGVIVK